MVTQIKSKAKNIVRALRLPFIIASILPFLFGSLIRRGNFNWPGFLTGFLAVIATHLGANLINDYADSKSGVDWQDRNFYGFFGGSKLIQEAVFSEKFYLYSSITCFALAFLCVISLALILQSISVVIFYLIVLFLAFSYSKGPIQFSYRRLGEIIIFLLFGPVPVMGGYFIQTKMFPDLRSLILSLPFGFLTTAILFANEIPDFKDDIKAGKFTWVSITGPAQAYILYYVLVFLAFSSIALSVFMGYSKAVVLFSFVFIILALKAAGILSEYYDDKARLTKSSKLTIDLQTFVGTVLIIGIFL